MGIKLLSPFSATRRKELLRMANDEWPIIIDENDPLVFILEFIDELIGFKVAFVAVMLVIVNILIDAGLIFLVVSFILTKI